ncbi:MAG: M23 family metallopeptidase [Caldicoprobacterales bacterium]|jgi:murein DD-endopeptidase MepM/ murein hydrolase activator NlpD|nr:M23 family metallopeptidase [Clostridiales bacterium]
MPMYAGRRYRRFYVADRTRFVLFLLILLLIPAALLLLLLNLSQSSGQYRADQFSSEHLLMYFELEEEMNVPWHYLAAVDLAEGTPPEDITRERSAGIALHLTGVGSTEQLPPSLTDYNNDKAFLRRVKREAEALLDLRAVYDNKVFPLDLSVEYTYEDGYGDARSFGGERSHEGIDIMTDKGVPIRSVCDGVIERSGWNNLGGYRLGIRGKDNIYYYYAHMSRYEGRPKEGDKVKAGQIIGYVGDTGYGEEGTTGQFLPHLHFGMYYGKGSRLRAFNPYPFLVAWEK